MEGSKKSHNNEELLPGGRDFVDRDPDSDTYGDVLFIEPPARMEPVTRTVFDHPLYSGGDELEAPLNLEPVDEVVETPNLDEKLPTSEQAKRLMFLYEQKKVQPHSKRELNHMFYLLEDRYSIGGSAKYLGIIIQHNNLDGADSLPTIIKIVGEFGDYAKNARGNISALTGLSQSLHQPGINGNEKLSDQSVMSDWQDGGMLQRAIGEMTRHVEGYLFAQGKGPDYLGSHYVSDDKEIIRREKDTITDMKVGFARRLIADVIAYETSRLEFWIEQLAGREKDEENNITVRKGAIDIASGAVQDRVRQILDDLGIKN
ncbi:MAG TPA: hypothetical protein PK265_01590 [Candidatus Saccharibacteria bacterium]|nr:hypothetical protein [Candidatus Saccharibacteria bacterium]